MIPAPGSSSSFHSLRSFNFFIYGAMAILSPYLPLYFQNEGYNNVQIGLLMSVGPIISLVANPFWGYWSDKLQNTRLIIIVMLVGNLVLSQLFFQVNGFIIVFMMLLLFYFFQTALNPISNSLILHMIENTSYQFGTFRLWGSLGFAVIAVVSSPFIGWLGIGKLGLIYGVFLLITIGLSLRLPRQGKQSQSGPFTMRDLSKVIANRYFIAFLLLGIIVSIPNRMSSTFISIYIGDLGGSAAHIGWSWFLAALMEVPVFLLLDRYLKKTRSVMFALLGIVSLLFAIRWFLMGIAVSPLQIILIQSLHGITFGVYFYTGTQLCDNLIPDAYRASGQSLYALTWMGLSGILAGLLGGFIFDTLGPRFMYEMSSWMSLVGMLGFFLMWSLLQRSKRSISQFE